MPICPQCGSYFVRKPCPSCSDKSYDDPYHRSETTTSKILNSIKETTKKPTIQIMTPINTLISEKKVNDTETLDEIKKLKNELNEKESEIQRLRKIIKSINREVSKL